MKVYENQKAFKGINNIKDFYNISIKLFENKNGFYSFTKEPIKYDQKTGEPIEYKEIPYQKWNGKIWITTIFNGLNIMNDEVTKLFLKKLTANGPIIYKNIIIEFIPERGEYGGTTPSYYQIKKVNRIEE